MQTISLTGPRTNAVQTKNANTTKNKLFCCPQQSMGNGKIKFTIFFFFSTFLAFLLVLFLIVHLFYNKNKKSNGGDDAAENLCDMTFMWRRMHFLNVQTGHPRYSLFLYGEGEYAENCRRNDFLDGFPILFVPGNAGSARQVRSIGSLLQNKTEQQRKNFHFDVFSVDFNEELTALDFDFIESQSNFLVDAIRSISKFYPRQNHPKIVLIGHSMGGIVIQAALRHPNFINNNDDDQSVVAFVLAFAVPFAEPIFFFDKRFLNFWKRQINGKKEEFDSKSQRLVSISGGLRDEFIDEEWTRTPPHNILPKQFHVSTAALDRVWLDVDHKCILWCNQLVRHTSRFLFDYAESPNEFIDNFQHYIAKHYHLPSLPPSDEESALVSKNEIQTHTFFNNKNNLTKNDNKKFDRITLFALSSTSPPSNYSSQLIFSIKGCDEQIESSVLGRYLDANNKFAFVNPSGCTEGAQLKIAENAKYLLLDRNSTYWRTPVQLNFFKLAFRSAKIKIVARSVEQLTFLQIPLNFVFSSADFCVYRVRIVPRKCKKTNSPRRAFFVVKNQIKRADSLGGRLQSSIFIFPQANNKNNTYKLLLVDTNKCEEHFLIFSLDLRFSLIRAFRRIRHISPFIFLLSLIFFWFIATRAFYASALLSLIAALTLREHTNSLSALFSLICTLLLSSISYILSFCVIRPILFKITNERTSSTFLGALNYRFFVGITAIFVLFLYARLLSAFSAVFCAFSNLLQFNCLLQGDTAFFVAFNAQMLFSFLQIPSIVTHFWRCLKYSEWRSPAFDSHFEANSLLILLSFTLQSIKKESKFTEFIGNKLLLKSQRMRRFVGISLDFSFIFSLFVVYFRNPLCFIVWDDLSLFVVLFLIYFLIKNNNF